MSTLVKPFKQFFKHFTCTAFSCTTSTYINSHINHFLSLQRPSSPLLLLKSHSLIITSGNSSDTCVASKLISLYTHFDFNTTTTATNIFNTATYKDVFLWNSIIQSHFSSGNYCKALEFYTLMRGFDDVRPNEFTVPMVVSACAEVLWVELGECVHGLVLKCGIFEGNCAVGSAFVYMYSKLGRVGDAWRVFDEMLVRDVVAWTAIIVGFVRNGECEMGLRCFRDMCRIGGEGEKANYRTMEGVLQGCGELGSSMEGRCVHGFVVKSGLGCLDVVRSSLLSMYSKCGSPQEAYFSFSEVVGKDLLCWTSIIGIYARFRLMKECLNLFCEMQIDGVYPDDIVISCIISGFGNSMHISEGKAFHGLMIRRNYVLNQMVHNALLSMYCKFGVIATAEKLFNGGNEQDKEAWNTMVSGYTKIRLETKCIELFRDMKHLGIDSDSNSLVSVIASCSHLGETRLGRSLHCYIIKCHLDENVSVANALIDMYGRCSNMNYACRIFNLIKRDIVTWNSLMSLYNFTGHYEKAIGLFDDMISEDMKPNSASLVTVITACSHLASLEKGESIYQYIREQGFGFNLSVATAFVDMYAKCGHLEKSRELFEIMNEKDVVAWNVMISGYGMHGHAKSSIEVFRLMEKSDVNPNEITFLALLSSCSHAGLVEEGKYLFARMKDYSLMPSLKHYACMIDLLGRSGSLEEAEALVLSMPMSPDGGVWGSLLNSCIIHNKVEMGIKMAKHAIESDPENDAYYIMLSNLYNSFGRWEDAETMREVMKKRGVGKIAGCSVYNIMEGAKKDFSGEPCYFETRLSI